MKYFPYNKTLALIFIPLLLITISACSDDDPTSSTNGGSDSTSGSESTPNIETESQKAKFENLLDSFIAKPTVVNSMFSLSDGTQSGSFAVARGEAAPGIPMTADHQFHLASITKTFTTTVLLQLIEEGNFELNTPLSTVFSDATMADLYPNHEFTMLTKEGVAVSDMTIDQLHMFGGQSFGGDITIKQLMQHSHGMPDLTFDAVPGSISLYDLTVAKNVESPRPDDGFPAQWSGPLLLEYYLASGLPNESLFKPGDGFHYGDTGPTISGLIIERVTGMSLAEAFRTRIFDPMGMGDTFLHHYEEPRQSSSAGLSHRYIDLSAAASSLGNIDIDADNWNTSIAWAGGGLVSTAADLEKFNRGLFGGRLLQDVSVIGAIENRIMQTDEDSAIGLGFYIHVNATDNTILSYEHDGFWGTRMYYFPNSEITASFTVNQVDYFFGKDELPELIDTLYLQ